LGIYVKFPEGNSNNKKKKNSNNNKKNNKKKKNNNNSNNKSLFEFPGVLWKLFFLVFLWRIFSIGPKIGNVFERIGANFQEYSKLMDNSDETYKMVLLSVGFSFLIRHSFWICQAKMLTQKWKVKFIA